MAEGSKVCTVCDAFYDVSYSACPMCGSYACDFMTAEEIGKIVASTRIQGVVLASNAIGEAWFRQRWEAVMDERTRHVGQFERMGVDAVWTLNTDPPTHLDYPFRPKLSDWLTSVDVRGSSVVVYGASSASRAITSFAEKVTELREVPSDGKRLFGAGVKSWAWRNRRRFKRSQRRGKHARR